MNLELDDWLDDFAVNDLSHKAVLFFLYFFLSFIVAGRVLSWRSGSSMMMMMMMMMRERLKRDRRKWRKWFYQLGNKKSKKSRNYGFLRVLFQASSKKIFDCMYSKIENLKLLYFKTVPFSSIFLSQTEYVKRESFVYILFFVKMGKCDVWVLRFSIKFEFRYTIAFLKIMKMNWTFFECPGLFDTRFCFENFNFSSPKMIRYWAEIWHTYQYTLIVSWTIFIPWFRYTWTVFSSIL